VVWAVAALAVISILLALRLDASAGAGTLFDGSSAESKATDRLHREFGEEPVLVLIRTRKDGCPGGRNCRLTDLLLTPDLIRVLSFEGCVSGNIPRRARTPAPVCERFTETKPFAAVNGPGTFINESARQISSRIRRQQRRSAAEVRQAEEAARRIAAARGLSQAEQDRLARQARKLAQVNALQPALRYGLNPRGAGIGDPSFVHQLVFEPVISFDAPKTRFAQFFPSRTSAVVELRPRPGLSEDERRTAVDLVRQAVANSAFRLKSARYVVTGEPVAAMGVAEHVSDELIILLIAALLIITATLALAFRSQRRLLPLLPAACAVAVAFGLMSLVGETLTIASIAVLPVLGGIAAGVALHYQRTGAIPVAPAAAAALGFAVLVTSPVPMVRTFGLFVSIGIALSVVLTATLGAALIHGDVRGPSFLRRPWKALTRALRRTSTALVRSLRRLPSRRVGLALSRGWTRVYAGVVRRPRTVVLVAAAVAALGWVLAPQSEVASGLGRLAPEGVQEVKDLAALGQESGTERGVNVIVTAPDLTAPGVIPWMVGYQNEVLRRHGFSEQKPCRQADLCPAVPLVDLFGTDRRRTRARTRALLERLPEYFTQGVISRDRRTANISFLIRRMPLDKQRDVIEDLRRQLDPPRGVSAELAGRTVLGADAADFGSNGRLLALLALGAVFVLIVGWSRRPFADAGTWPIGRAIACTAALAIGAGWSALIVLAPGVSLNTMSATLGALAIGLGGYAAIHLAGRYRAAQAGGMSPEAALGRAYGGGAVLLSSGATALAGFVTLVVSDVRMLHQFGWIAALDLAVVLFGVVLVLSAALVWAEKLKVPRSRAEWRAAARGGYGRVRGGIGAAGRTMRGLPAAVGRLRRNEGQRP
jgi:predicted RND superfamily exporter protein